MTFTNLENQQKPGVFTVVLTGGIAAGKTAVSKLFARLGVPVIDTDLIARELVEPGQPALQTIIETFGTGCLGADGRLDRKAMRSIIFSDPAAKAGLEGILHPLIRAAVDRSVAELSSEYCIVVIPLFARRESYERVDRVLVVDVDEETQISRVMKRDGITRNSADSMLENQISRGERLALADDIIVNDGGLGELADKVRKLHSLYLSLAERAS